MVAYPAAVALGKVLLQTAPARGLPGAQMEAFLRVMREVCTSGFFVISHSLTRRLAQLENHPHIVHLPAPHLWQLTPATGGHGEDDEGGCLVATVQLHVRKDLDDNGALALTSEVWERCSRALGVSAVSVTVSVVRG